MTDKTILTFVRELQNIVSEVKNEIHKPEQRSEERKKELIDILDTLDDFVKEQINQLDEYEAKL